MVHIFGHVDGEERMAGELGVGGQWQLPDHDSEDRLGTVGRWKYRAREKVFPGESSAFFNANGGDACGCCNTLEGAIVGTFIVLELRVKLLDHLVSTMAA
jgi:hypothetical protein